MAWARYKILYLNGFAKKNGERWIVTKILKNSKIPHKNTKKNKLTKEQKEENRELSSVRILVENVIACVKKFKILSERYRNRRKRFGLRFNLIAGIHNFELEN